MTDEYNGWTNRETWALNLWLSNDQGLYEFTRERVSQALEDVEDGATEYVKARRAGEAVAELWDELTDEAGDFAPLSEEMRTAVRDVGSVWRVDFDKIGAHWFVDVTENPVDDDPPCGAETSTGLPCGWPRGHTYPHQGA